jgi:hypothetical protein
MNTVWKLIRKAIMSQYTPDRWEMIQLKPSNPEEKGFFAIMASWYGGWAGSDSWKRSSAIESIVDKDTYWEVHNESGSVYMCYKKSRGMSGYTSSVYNRMAEQAGTQGWTTTVEEPEDVIKAVS